MARIVLTFTSTGGTGPVSAPGVKTGDEVLFVFATDSGTDASSAFAKFAVTDDVMYQTDALGIHTITAILDRELVV